MGKELRVLMIEDVATDAELEVRELKRAGLRVVHRLVETEDAFRAAMREFAPNIIISDFSMPHFDGMWALQVASEIAPEVPFIFVSGTIGEEYAIRALKNGATDYVLKSNLVRLPAAVERALQESRERAAKRRTELELEQTRSRLDSIVSSLPDVVWSISLKPYRMLYVSRAIESIWRRPARTFYDNPDARMEQIHPDDRGQVEHSWQAALAGGAFDAVYRIVHEDGTVRWIHDRAHPIRDEDDQAVRLDGLARDITEFKLQEQRIARLSRIHAVLSGINSAIVRIRDRQMLFAEACRIAVEHGGFGMAWIGMLDLRSLVVTPVASAGVEADSFIAQRLNSASTNTPLGRGIVGRAVREKQAIYSNDLLAETSPGGTRRREAIRRGYRSLISLPLMVDAAAVGSLSLYAREPGFFDDEEIKLLTELADDISFALEHIAKEEKLNFLAYYEPLTGLPNRTLFNDRLVQRIGAARDGRQEFSVILLDIERFRLVNDTLGRPAGDDLLRQVSRRLQDALQPVDLIAHFGGDHFAIATRRGGESATAVHLLEQVLTCLSGGPFAVGGEELHVAVKAGVSVYPADGADADSLLRNGEAALKDAKRTGQRFVFYAPQMNARVSEQLKLENDLRSALQQEQFTLHYQPRFDLASGRLVGMEALMRWRHPERGMVSPAAFIPLLEEMGLILDAGCWALRRAALDYVGWRGAGRVPPRIAVNVSQVQLRRPGFVDDVKDALARVDRVGDRIEIEITESMLMEDVEGTIAKLRALRQLGLKVAIDDFGTGYSSLSYLARLPIDSLKIDRSFIVQMSSSPEQMAIVSTVISLARALNLKVCAEGVETEEQANHLRLLCCDEVQGYLFGKPAPADVIMGLLPRD